MGSSFWTILVTQCNHKGPHKSEVRGSEFEREDVRMEGEVQVEEDALWVALKAEEGATSQGIQAGSRSSEGQGDGFSTTASRRNQPCQHLDFSAVRSVSDFWPPEL